MIALIVQIVQFVLIVQIVKIVQIVQIVLIVQIVQIVQIVFIVVIVLIVLVRNPALNDEIGLSPSEKKFGLPGRADRLKIFTLNKKDRLSFAEGTRPEWFNLCN
jgi:hypothetical protein